MLFSGDLRRQLDPWARADDETILEALEVANAHDVLDALPEGLDAEVDERARSFSGGQRQRLALARALLADAETLVLVEPTSAVDAHTEARIARSLRSARDGTDDGDRRRRARSCSTRPTGSCSSRTASCPRSGRTASCSARAPTYRDTVTRGESD